MKTERPRFAYFPFGGGGRQCIGESFAMMEATLALATIAQRWQLKIDASHPIALQPKITLRPRYGVRATPVARRSDALDSYCELREFLGNSATVTHLRESIAAGRFPQAMILAGPRGAGKYTLALMLARAVNCLEPTESDGLPDFCGRCRNCERIGESANLEERVAEAVAARDEMRDVDKRETRILIQTHPDVLIVPPDPPQLMIKMGQVRQVIHVAYYRPPVEARRSFTIFTSSAFMKEAANSLLKVLEEPPEHTSLILLTENPQELLPTIRSRAIVHRLGALPAAELEACWRSDGRN